MIKRVSMRLSSSRRRSGCWLGVAIALGLAVTLVAPAAGADTASAAGSADALRKAWMSDGTSATPPPALPGGLRITSSQTNDVLSARLLGVIDQPFADVQAAVSDPAGWCAVLILDPNVHTCRVAGSTVEVALGQTDTPVVFAFTRSPGSADHAQSRLSAPEGPFGTRDYIIGFEAAPLTPHRTLVQLTFTQRFTWAARMAMAAYFATSGRKKVGFTVVDHDAEGRPVYIGDLRGGIERNLVRYFLAIEANVASRGVPTAQQPEARVRSWLAGTERYPAQLREAPAYFERKLPEVRRQMTGQVTGR